MDRDPSRQAHESAFGSVSLPEQKPIVPSPESPLSPPFRSLFEAEFLYVCRALRQLGVRECDLEDVAQELFITIHRHLPEYDPRRPLRPWLFSFSLRFASNYRRLLRNRGHVSDESLRTPEDGASADVEARDLVLRALGALDTERRVVIVMHDLEGFAAPEIASQLGVPLNTIYSRIRLGRADFKRAVEALQAKGGAA